MGTIVISPAAELGKHITWLSLLQGAGLVLEPLAMMRAFVSSDLYSRSRCKEASGFGHSAAPSTFSLLSFVAQETAVIECKNEALERQRNGGGMTTKQCGGSFDGEVWV